MAIITPNVNPSQALIPVGFPLVSIAKSNPLSTMGSGLQGAPVPAPEVNGTGVAASVKLNQAQGQAGDQGNRSL